MAADQRKRRLSSATPFGHAPPPPLEQCRTKKRDFRHHSRPQFDFNFNSHVSLKWDENGKRVVAKEEQVGVSWRQLSSCVPVPGFGISSSSSNAKLADVVSVPKEVFELDDLSGVLSYEVWRSVLSEKERSSLAQFLPPGFEPDQLVEGLLGGDNFHFGNPSLQWGAALCSGGLHPDAIVQHEKSLKRNKKAYYSELQQYHVSMIQNLQQLKDRCASSKDPEAEIQLIMSRSRRHADKNILPGANGFRSRKPEDNAPAMSESPSSLADEKLYYSDNQKLSAFRDAEIQKRIRSEDAMKDRQEKSMVSTSSAKIQPKPKKAEKLQKVHINSNDGAKYMSYVKISKKQLELFKSMKQSGSNIQSKTLNRVLGNLDSNVKPYEMFVEEEQNRVHEYWSNMARRDVPVALENWRRVKSKRQQITKSLWHEMEEKLRRTKDDKLHLQDQDDKSVGSHDEEAVDPQDMEGEGSPVTSEHHPDNEPGTPVSISDTEMDSDPSSRQNEPPVHNLSFNVNEEFNPSSAENQCSVPNSPLNVNEEFHLSPIENQPLIHNPSLDVEKEYCSMDLNAESNNVISDTSNTFSRVPIHHVAAPQTSEGSPSVSVSHPESHSSASNAKVEETPFSSVKNVWTSIGLPESYHHIPTTQYSSGGEPSFHPQLVPEPPARLIDLESDLPEEDTTKDLLNRHTNHMPFFNPFPNRNRSELLHSLVKSDTYQEPRKAGLEFHPTTSVVLDPIQFPSHFREQLQPSFGSDNRQKTQNELFLNQTIQDPMYPDNRFPIQGQGPFPTTLNVRDWSNTRISNPIQPPQMSSGDMLNHNWFAAENRAHGGWSASDGAVFSNPSIGSGSSGDQSLYSVLSQCNTLQSRAPYNPMSSTEQMIPPPTNYAQDIAGGIPMTSNGLPPMASPFDYLSGNEAAATALKNTNMGWMSLGHQTSGLHDPSEKPFLKSWNQ